MRVRETFGCYCLAVSQGNGELRADALQALEAEGIILTDLASLTRRRIPTVAVQAFTDLCGAIEVSDRLALKEATDRLRKSGLKVRLTSGFQSWLSMQATKKQLMGK